MLLVIFGAGASYDSLPRVPHPTPGDQSRPPLANGLFGARNEFLDTMRNFPQISDIVPYLQQPRNNSIEFELQHINDTAKDYPPNFGKLLAVRYYLQIIIRITEDGWKSVTRGHTNHAALLGEIDRWGHGSQRTVLLATFNYDRLIEDALKTLGIFVDTKSTLESYVSHPVYKLFKIHGSVNWARMLDNVEKVDPNENQWAVAERNIQDAQHIKLSNTICIDLTYPIGHINGFRCIPAIAIPIQTKSSIECPEGHMAALKQELPQVEKILILGWRGTEKTFTSTLAGALRENRPHILVACGSQQANQETIKQLLSDGMDGDYEPFNGGFSELVVTRETTKWLNRPPQK